MSETQKGAARAEETCGGTGAACGRARPSWTHWPDTLFEGRGLSTPTSRSITTIRTRSRPTE